MCDLCVSLGRDDMSHEDFEPYVHASSKELRFGVTTNTFYNVGDRTAHIRVLVGHSFVNKHFTAEKVAQLEAQPLGPSSGVLKR
jgi:hypothetical protein